MVGGISRRLTDKACRAFIAQSPLESVRNKLHFIKQRIGNNSQFRDYKCDKLPIISLNTKWP